MVISDRVLLPFECKGLDCLSRRADAGASGGGGVHEDTDRVPRGVDWNLFSNRVPEADVEAVVEILRVCGIVVMPVQK